MVNLSENLFLTVKSKSASVKLNFGIFDFGTNLGVAIGQCLIKIILTLNRDRLNRNIKCVKFQ